MNRPSTLVIRDAVWGCVFAVFGLAFMVTTPTGSRMAAVHMIAAIVGLLGAAALWARANDRHADDRRRQSRRGF